VNVTIENPYVGPDSSFEVHQDELAPFKGDLPTVRELVPKEDVHFIDLTEDMKNNLVKMILLSGKPTKEFSFMDLIGKRISVHWTEEQGAEGWWEGEIADYEPLLGKFWIKYDVADENGVQHTPQELLRSRAWKPTK
jgi:hypothetical protein